MYDTPLPPEPDTDEDPTPPAWYYLPTLGCVPLPPCPFCGEDACDHERDG